MKKIINIVICYNNPHEVAEYAKKLKELKYSSNITLVVVVNSIDSDQFYVLEKLKKEQWFEVLIAIPSQNLGYMNGLLFGYKEYKSIHSSVPDLVIMSNTDIKYDDKLFLERLMMTQYSDEVYAIGPAVYSQARKSFENPVAYTRRTLSEINRLIFILDIPVIRTLYLFASDVKARIKKTGRGVSDNVYEVHGCYFILKGVFAELIKEKKYGALMYSEEAFISEEIYKLGKKEFYDSELYIEHLEHSVTGLLGAKKIAKYIVESMKVIKKEYYSNE